MVRFKPTVILSVISTYCNNLYQISSTYIRYHNVTSRGIPIESPLYVPNDIPIVIRHGTALRMPEKRWAGKQGATGLIDAHVVSSVQIFVNCVLRVYVQTAYTHAIVCICLYNPVRTICTSIIVYIYNY